jgi:uncharacterized protein
MSRLERQCIISPTQKMLHILNQMKSDAAKLDRRAVFALVYAAAGLTCIYYLKAPEFLVAILRFTPLRAVGEAALNPVDNNLYALIWWAIVSVFFYFVIPASVVVLVQKRALRDVGLALNIEQGFAKLLVAGVVIMLPLVYLMSLTNGFSNKYPFLQVYGGGYSASTLLVWEIFYFLQFFGLEFFFRGFLLHSLKPSLGLYSILVMTVPYTMIHFQKPMAETFAAIFAGLFLGWLSYKNGNIWMGLVLHCIVAFSMDILALYNKGLLF